MTENATRKAVYPSVPTRDFKWTSGADVQATWRKWGWTPPSEKLPPPPPEKPVPVVADATVPRIHRFK
jgi:hypothetical protein